MLTTQDGVYIFHGAAEASGLAAKFVHFCSVILLEVFILGDQLVTFLAQLITGSAGRVPLGLHSSFGGNGSVTLGAEPGMGGGHGGQLVRVLLLRSKHFSSEVLEGTRQVGLHPFEPGLFFLSMSKGRTMLVDFGS